MSESWIGEAPCLHLAFAGSGPVAAVIVTGMANAAKVRAAQLSDVLGGAQVCAVSLPSLAGLTLDDAVARVAALLDSADGPMPLLIADNIAGGFTARVVKRLRRPPGRLLLAGQRRTVQPPSGEIHIDGTHLTQLWHFLRDFHIDGAGEEIPDTDALSTAFLEAAEDPAGYAALWQALTRLRRPDWDTVASLSEIGIVEGGVTFPALLPSTRRMVETPRGAMHVRTDGASKDSRPLLLLHHGPGATPVIDDVIAGLDTSRPTIAPDFLGCGRSDRIDAPVTIETLAEDMLALLDALGIVKADIFGTHTGALVALQLANIAPERVGRLILEGFTPPITADPDAIMRAYPTLGPVHSGTHLAEAWTMRRDMFRFAPFVTPVRAAQRHITPADAPFLHRWTMTLLHGAPSFRHVMRAAFAYDGATALAKLTHPALVCAGPEDSLHAGLALTVPIAPPNVTIRETPATLWHPGQKRADVAATLKIYRDFLRG